MQENTLKGDTLSFLTEKEYAKFDNSVQKVLELTQEIKKLQAKKHRYLKTMLGLSALAEGRMSAPS